MFIRLTVSNKDGQKEKRLVNIADISVVKPSLSCVTLISQNDFPIWARETVEELETALINLGVDVCPHEYKE
jgi:hypothetical protein